jgi:sulfate adenylyltransferase
VDHLALSRRQYMEMEKIGLGAFAPLSGFMNEDQFRNVVDHMRLPDGAPFPLPVILDITGDQAKGVRPGARLALVFDGLEVGELSVESIYGCEKESAAQKIFGTRDSNHPGVAHFFRMGQMFVGGQIRLKKRAHFEFSDDELTPEEARAYVAERAWQTVVGFQTRNMPHGAHEYLHRLALERADGLLIQPIVGWRKRGDYNPAVILKSYKALIDGFLPKRRVLLSVLSIAMRYAGPREAVFHAIIRRNYGCTHFIVGRDHAGVGDYYGKYEAHELTRRFDGELGIKVLRFFGPFLCSVCDGIVTERTCPHIEREPHATHQISGTEIREMLSNGEVSVPGIIRQEIVDSVANMPLFLDEEDE